MNDVIHSPFIADHLLSSPYAIMGEEAKKFVSFFLHHPLRKIIRALSNKKCSPLGKKSHGFL